MVNLITNTEDLESNNKLVAEADSSTMTKANVQTPEEVSKEQKNATVTELEDGSVEVTFEDDEPSKFASDIIEAFNEIPHDQNIAELLDKEDLRDIAQDVLDRLEDDKQSRSEWNDIIENGLKMLGLSDTSDEEIFEGSSTVYHPLIIEQAVDFQSKAINELLPAKDPVKVQILGEPTKDLVDQSNRVADHMNYQVQHQMTDYYDEKEKKLFYLANTGSAFTKTYYDYRNKRPCVDFIPVEDFYVNYYAKSLESAPCYTQIIQKTVNDLIRDQISGLYLDDIDLKELTANEPAPEVNVQQEHMDEVFGSEQPNRPIVQDNNAINTILEQHVDLDLPEPYGHPDGLALPYIVHVHEESRKVLAIYKNWEEGDSDYKKICWFTHYKYVPCAGFYGLGNIHLLGNLVKSMTLSLRSLLDAGMMSNTSSGFKTKKAKIVNADEPHVPGEYKDVEGMFEDLSKAFYTIDFKEPSQTLFHLFKEMDGMSHRFADKSDQIITEANNNGPVGTTIALLEASMKFFSAVHKRCHNSQKHEFKLIAKLNSMYLEAGENELLIPNSTLTVMREDYSDRLDILPVSDPNMPSSAHRVAMAQTSLQAGQQAPHLHNMKELYRSFHVAVGTQNVDVVIPEDKEPTPMSPFEDIQAAMNGEPIKAFEGQDHDAHMKSKMAWIQSPTGGASPIFATIVPSIEANIREHMYLDYVNKVKGMSENPEDDAANAMVAQDVTKFMQEKAEMEAQGGPNPAEQKIAEAELINAKSRDLEVKNKVQKDSADTALKAQEMELKRAELEAKTAQADEKIDIERMKAGSTLVQKAVDNMLSLVGKSDQSTPDPKK